MFKYIACAVAFLLGMATAGYKYDNLCPEEDSCNYSNRKWAP